MLGTNIGIAHMVAELRYRELIAEAAHQRNIDGIVAIHGRSRRNGISEARAAVANALIRVGSWLMPEDPRGHAGSGGFELRPGR